MSVDHLSMVKFLPLSRLTWILYSPLRNRSLKSLLWFAIPSAVHFFILHMEEHISFVTQMDCLSNSSYLDNKQSDAHLVNFSLQLCKIT